MTHSTKSNRDATRLIRLGAVVCGIGVALGALGAHALEGVIGDWYVAETAAKKLSSWDTAVRYQLIHGLGLIAIGLLLRSFGDCRRLRIAAACFLFGTVLFSGDLYLWVLTDIKAFVLIVPVGGFLFIIGWVLVACGRLQNSDPSPQIQE